MRAVGLAAAVAAATVALVSAQTPDGSKLRADVRAALGGESSLSAVKTLTFDGTLTRMTADGTAGRALPLAIAVELPEKYARRDGLGDLNGTPIARTVGFNGATPFEVMDAPQPAGGRQMFVRAGRGSQGMSTAGTTDPAARAELAIATRRDFARLMLGAFAAGTPAFPLEFAAGGEATSGGQTADILTVTGPDGFSGRLYVDRVTRLPLLFSWMDKEPLVLAPSGTPTSFSGGLTAEQAAELRRDREQRIREAEAKRRVVEYRLFYADYRTVGAVKLPTRLQTMIDGRVTEELVFEKVDVNPSIDPKRFGGR